MKPDWTVLQKSIEDCSFYAVKCLNELRNPEDEISITLSNCLYNINLIISELDAANGFIRTLGEWTNCLE